MSEDEDESEFDSVFKKKVNCEKDYEDDKEGCEDDKDCDWIKKKKECVAKDESEVATAMA